MNDFIEPTLDKNQCQCGELGVRKTSNREPICQRCYDLEKNLNYQIRANRMMGKQLPKKERVGPQIKWDNYYAYILDDQPIADASLKALPMLAEMWKNAA